MNETRPHTHGSHPQFGTTFGTSSRTRPYTVREVAASLQISERAVLKRIAAGKIAARRVGREWRILLESPINSAPLGEPHSERGTVPPSDYVGITVESGSERGSEDGSEPPSRAMDTARQLQVETVLLRILQPLVEQNERLSTRVESLARENGVLQERVETHLTVIAQERGRHEEIMRERETLLRRVEELQQQILKAPDPVAQNEIPQVATAINAHDEPVPPKRPSFFHRILHGNFDRTGLPASR